MEEELKKGESWRKGYQAGYAKNEKFVKEQIDLALSAKMKEVERIFIQGYIAGNNKQIEWTYLSQEERETLLSILRPDGE